MGEKRLSTPNKARLRNLKQYKDLSDEEFDELWAKKILDLEPVKEFEQRIERKLEEFEKDYDLSDMKFNDRETLRALAQTLITLEDYEQLSYKIRGEGNLQDNLIQLDKLNKFMSDLRSDISKMQDDLKISRKARKASGEESVISFLEELKEKSRAFLEEKMMYIFCNKCNMLLATTWFLYPDSDKNKITLVCNRRLDNDEVCGNKVTITSKELFEMNGSNKLEIMPESMR